MDKTGTRQRVLRQEDGYRKRSKQRSSSSAVKPIIPPESRISPNLRRDHTLSLRNVVECTSRQRTKALCSHTANKVTCSSAPASPTCTPAQKGEETHQTNLRPQAKSHFKQREVTSQSAGMVAVQTCVSQTQQSTHVSRHKPHTLIPVRIQKTRLKLLDPETAKNMNFSEARPSALAGKVTHQMPSVSSKLYARPASSAKQPRSATALRHTAAPGSKIYKRAQSLPALPPVNAATQQTKTSACCHKNIGRNIMREQSKLKQICEASVNRSSAQPALVEKCNEHIRQAKTEGEDADKSLIELSVQTDYTWKIETVRNCRLKDNATLAHSGTEEQLENCVAAQGTSTRCHNEECQTQNPPNSLLQHNRIEDSVAHCNKKITLTLQTGHGAETSRLNHFLALNTLLQNPQIKDTTDFKRSENTDQTDTEMTNGMNSGNSITADGESASGLEEEHSVIWPRNSGVIRKSQGVLVLAKSTDQNPVFVPKLKFDFTPDNSIDYTSLHQGQVAIQTQGPSQFRHGGSRIVGLCTPKGPSLSKTLLKMSAMSLGQSPCVGTNSEYYPCNDRCLHVKDLYPLSKIVDLSISFQGTFLEQTLPDDIPKILLTDDMDVND